MPIYLISTYPDLLLKFLDGFKGLRAGPVSMIQLDFQLVDLSFQFLLESLGITLGLALRFKCCLHGFNGLYVGPPAEQKGTITGMSSAIYLFEIIL